METEDKLVKKLKETRKILEEGFSEKAIGALQTEGIIREMNRFAAGTVKDVVNELQIASETIQSPVYVGMLGRYSHGKSALVNALFDMNDECRLPEGEGVVTSKVTHVKFDDTIVEGEAIAVTGENEETDSKSIPIPTLLNSVGKSDEDTSSISYYKWTMPTSGRDFARLFCNKNINLIDMPGLGGPFFKDKTETSEYVKELDMIVAVIKINEISLAGHHIDNYIKMADCPVIPVLTFEDLWENSDLYAGCETFDDMEKKAKELIKEHIPSLEKHLINLIAVSAKTRHNINQLRELIINKVDRKQLSIRSSRKESSEIYKRQVKKLKKEFDTLKPKLKQLVDDLGNQMKQNQSGGGDEVPVSSVFENSKLRREEKNFINGAKHEIDNAARVFESQCYALRNKNTESELSETEDALERKSAKSIAANSAKELFREFEQYKKEVIEEIDHYIDEKLFDTLTKKELKNKIRDAMNGINGISDWEDALKIEFDRSLLNKEHTTHAIKQFGEIVKELIKDPISLILLGIGVLLSFAGGIGIIVIVIAIGQLLLRVPGIQKKQLHELRENIYDLTLSFFDKSSIITETEKKFEELKKSMIHGITDVLHDDTHAYNADKQKLQKLQDEIERSVDELSVEIEIRVKSL